MDAEYQERIIEKAAWLKALSHPIRLCLAYKLSQEDGLTVTHFVSCMDASQSSISQHLAKLRNLGLVSYEKKGNKVLYSLTDEPTKRIVEAIFEED